MERCCLPGATSKATVTLASLLRGTNRDGYNTRHVVTNQRARRNRLDAESPTPGIVIDLGHRAG